MAKDGSRHEREAVDAQRGGYDVSDHYDENINPHNELPHESNGLTSSGRDTAGRLIEYQNAHRKEDQSQGLGTLLTLWLTGRYRNSTALPEATPQGRQAPSQEHMGNQRSENVYIKRESPDLHSNHLSSRGESTNMATRAERHTQGKDPLLRKFQILMISLVYS